LYPHPDSKDFAYVDLPGNDAQFVLKTYLEQFGLAHMNALVIVLHNRFDELAPHLVELALKLNVPYFIVRTHWDQFLFKKKCDPNDAVKAAGFRKEAYDAHMQDMKKYFPNYTGGGRFYFVGTQGWDGFATGDLPSLIDDIHAACFC